MNIYDRFEVPQVSQSCCNQNSEEAPALRRPPRCLWGAVKAVAPGGLLTVWSAAAQPLQTLLNVQIKWFVVWNYY